MSRATMPPGTPSEPPVLPVTIMTASELLDRATHIAAEHPDVMVGLCLIAEKGDEEGRSA